MKNSSFKTIRRLPIAFIFIVLTCNYNSYNNANAQNNITTDLQGKGINVPYFGFNAKGAKNTGQQTRYASDYLDRLDDSTTAAAANKSNLVVRVTGGTQSQVTYMADWSDYKIDKWVSLQQKQGIRFIYVVNGNDTPDNQVEVINNWIDKGVHFDFIEMMNEYYLPKYANGDTSKPEVSEHVTPEKYVNTILPTFWNKLDQFNLPYYLILGPTKPNVNANERIKHWNHVVWDAINNTYSDRDLNVTIHLYIGSADDINQFDYDQIDRARDSMPSGRHIAITEAGVNNKDLNYEEVAEAAIEHYSKIVEHLGPGDYLLDQVLYKPSTNDNTADLNPNSTGGVTPKGEAMLQFILDGLQ